MSDERELILQMVADGKITPQEADQLLQTIDESEKVAQAAATESVRQRSTAPPDPTQRRTVLFNLGETIESAVREGLRATDIALRNLEVHVDKRYMDDHLRHKIEDKIRKSTEKAVEKAREAEERAVDRVRQAQERMERHAQRVAERSAETAQRMAERLERRFASRHWDSRPQPPTPPTPPAGPSTFMKVGVNIDKVSTESTVELTLPWQSGDRLRLDNRVGDIAVAFTDGDQVEVEAKKTVWGTDEADAEARSAATSLSLKRSGADVAVAVSYPTINGVGVVMIKDTRIDYTVRVPRGTQLDLRTKVGNVTVTAADTVSLWTLQTQVGDVDVTVGPAAGFRWDARTKVGAVRVALSQAATLDLPGGATATSVTTGRAGDGAGQLMLEAKTGDIRIHN